MSSWPVESEVPRLPSVPHLPATRTGPVHVRPSSVLRHEHALHEAVHSEALVPLAAARGSSHGPMLTSAWSAAIQATSGRYGGGNGWGSVGPQVAPQSALLLSTMVKFLDGYRPLGAQMPHASSEEVVAAI